MNAVALLKDLKTASATEVDIELLSKRCYAAMNDDFNSPVLIAELFEATRIINSVHDGKLKIDAANLEQLKKLMNDFVTEILGLKDEQGDNDDLPNILNLIVKLRNEAKGNMDYATSDKIRDGLQKIGIQLKDSKEGTTWNKM